MDRDKTETSPTYFQDPVTYQSKNSEMKSGIGRKLTTVQRYTFRIESKFSERESSLHHRQLNLCSYISRGKDYS